MHCATSYDQNFHPGNVADNKTASRLAESHEDRGCISVADQSHEKGTNEEQKANVYGLDLVCQ